MDWYLVGIDMGQTPDFAVTSVVERKQLVGEFHQAQRAHEKLARPEESPAGPQKPGCNPEGPPPPE
jgi:hypothetical protein